MPNDASPSAPVAVDFRGRAGEWFGIWITNLLLTIVTLGIYSAWAKVRRKKYFYQHTFVAGRNFDYHATGKQILIGRIIVVVGFILYSVLSAIPVVAVVMLVGLLFLVPYLLVRSLRFNAVMSSWANVRFGFDGTTAGAFRVYLLYPFLAGLTAFTTWPFASRAVRRFAIGNHRLGAAPLAFASGIGPFYAAFLAAIAWVLIAGAGTALALAPHFRALSVTPENPDPAAATAVAIGVYAFLFLGILPAATVYGAFIRNTVFNGTTLDGKHRFRSDIAPIRLIWIALSNACVALLTLGLMLPWAQIRLTRYLADHTQLVPDGSLDEFHGLAARASALGDAYTDIEGFDIGLPV